MTKSLLPRSVRAAAALGAAAVLAASAAAYGSAALAARAERERRLDAARNLNAAHRTLDRERLIERAALAADMPRLRAAAVTPGLPKDALESVADAARARANADVAVLFDGRGRWLAGVAADGTAATATAAGLAQTAVASALRGVPSAGDGIFGGLPHDMAAVPIRHGEAVDGVLLAASAVPRESGFPAGMPSPADERRLPLRSALIVLLIGGGLLALALTHIREASRRADLARRIFGESGAAGEDGDAAPALLQTIMHAIPVPALLLDSSGAIRSANAAAGALLPRDAQGGRHVPIGTFLADRDGVPLDPAARTEPLRGVEALWSRGDGRRASVLVFTARVLDEAVLCLLQDLEERRQLHSLRHAYDQLKQLPGGGARAREEAAPSSGIEPTLRGLVHQVKNPLATLQQGLDYLRQSAQHPEQDDVLNTMAGAIGQIDAVVTGALRANLPPVLDLGPQNFAHLLEDSLGACAGACAAQRIGVVREFAPSLLPVLADPAQMRRALDELCRNAVQAMPRGGTLTVSCRQDRLTEIRPHVGARATDRFRIGQTALVCEIRDTGAGVEDAQQAKLFEPFATTRMSGQGAGLGLATARMIVQAHGGSLELESRAGAGACARLLLPLAPAAGGAEKTRILLIDDDVSLCKMVKLNLEHGGDIDVETAYLGAEGLRRALEERFDLVITDFQMPDMTGDQVLERIKAARPELPVLLFSIYHDLNVPITPEVRGRADGLLKKPIDHRELHAAINQALHRPPPPGV